MFGKHRRLINLFKTNILPSNVILGPYLAEHYKINSLQILINST